MPASEPLSRGPDEGPEDWGAATRSPWGSGRRVPQARAKKLRQKVQAKKSFKKDFKPNKPTLSTPTRDRSYAPVGQCPYDSKSLILVVGDGDFSFARGLAKRIGSGEKLYATSLDSSQTVLQKYNSAPANLQFLKQAHANILHNVDATKLERSFKSERFDRIIFNFPHCGDQRVHLNRELLLNFFRSARDFLRDEGQIHVTIKVRPPYSEWGVEERAKEAGLILRKIIPFDQRLYPGYRHQTTKADAKTFVAASEQEAKLCKTFVFVSVKKPPPPPEAPKPTSGKEGSADTKEKVDPTSFWDKKTLAELSKEIQAMVTHADKGGWGGAEEKYKDVDKEEDIDDQDIDATLDQEEAQHLSRAGWKGLLKAFGEELPRSAGKEPNASASHKLPSLRLAGDGRKLIKALCYRRSSMGMMVESQNGIDWSHLIGGYPVLDTMEEKLDLVSEVSSEKYSSEAPVCTDTSSAVGKFMELSRNSPSG
ncbi:hypothetical protein GUITHDRAFT_104114 [Guillardia theta CCMP2712]|uniref:25S rRNA (uridine-N(3))-methyltransferase BMT5-like domain-containing protein n=1 Tax=Guillardia theta (strain CCMP2712) TaxID=905079 RepID=L1JPX7_GUITC|nr:hypothetical protein GUITHDRAFT_104114 [Guillardia theta CCMP2712]EKX50304.1 hypothetical protein GUITHDRAFT_104114 [Guillardia theta CCMP2712]|eukprot:XP_005837284.1 hypothetical protein GUITHDRAFT_104114 [Guillardia theta CCMP2712]